MSSKMAYGHTYKIGISLYDYLRIAYLRYINNTEFSHLVKYNDTLFLLHLFL